MRDFDPYMDQLSPDDLEREFAGPTQQEWDAAMADAPPGPPVADADIDDMADRSDCPF